MEVSALLADMGYHITLIEKTDDVGGKLLQWHHLFPTQRPASDILEYIASIRNNSRVDLKLNTAIKDISYQKDHILLQTSTDESLEAQAVVISTGFDVFKARNKEEYGYGIYENVITSVDLEAMLKEGKGIRMTNGKTPKRIAFIHCVGSRDEKSGNHYCSKVCCITGVKQAIELHQLIPDAEIYCFYMDLRMYGKGYEELYRDAQEKHDIQFIRGRLSEASENIDESLLIKAEDTLSGRPLKMNIDLLVLLVGVEAGEGSIEIGRTFNLDLDADRFLKVKDIHTHRNLSSQKGVFLAGTCICPMSVNDSLENARSAAFEVHQYLQNKIKNE